LLYLVGTNNSNCELFAAVAGAHGSGIPLAYCLIQTSPNATAGAKQAILTSFLGELRKLGIMPEFTLSDKDWSEINAMKEVWPRAKHQLCFWHALRALKQRLSKNKITPAAYDPKEAQHEFSFINSSFVPLAQQDLLDLVCAIQYVLLENYLI
jgi:FPC/CPF motif-containing protein YcgG